jgi:hypothetical protein
VDDFEESSDEYEDELDDSEFDPTRNYDEE